MPATKAELTGPDCCDEQFPAAASAQRDKAAAAVLSRHALRSIAPRIEGYLAQVLQRRRNHDAFQVRRVDVDEQPKLAGRFAIKTLPTIVVIDNKHVEARLEAPTGCREIEAALAPWPT